MRHASTVRVYAVVDLRSRSDDPLAGALETFMDRADAERFIEATRRDDPQLATHLRIAERELETRLLGAGVSRRVGCLGAAAAVVILFALLAWWWSTVELFDIGLL